jgi:hypothetical protein
MATRREREQKRRQQQTEQLKAAYRKLCEKLEAAQTWADAQLIVNNGPEPDARGRRFYSNLDVLLQTSIPPGDASRQELQMYMRFIERERANTVLKPGAADKMIRDLRKAIDEAMFDEPVY